MCFAFEVVPCRNRRCDNGKSRWRYFHKTIFLCYILRMNKKIIEKIKIILKARGVTKAAIFGSYARGEQKRNSDVDLLVELPEEMTLFGMGGLKVDLEEKIGKKVDLVEYHLLHPLLKDDILKEQIPIL